MRGNYATVELGVRGEEQIDLPEGEGDEYPSVAARYCFSREKQFKQEVAGLKARVILESYLTLSPLVLESRFYDERVFSGFDPFGSNAGLNDAGTAVHLLTSRDSLSAVDPSASAANPPPRAFRRILPLTL
ncbi:hypothetical protein F2Q70_00003267 [Brassica cretica]|uniref:Uncharacterized protein n=1 Tax=Brassica cretica TaxID=69181 RepID=A0A8S9IXI7_BRACR|nr:hypothetical protein F2Q70_00003267 [Brassica cretica]